MIKHQCPTSRAKCTEIRMVSGMCDVRLTDCNLREPTTRAEVQSSSAVNKKQPERARNLIGYLNSVATSVRSADRVRSSQAFPATAAIDTHLAGRLWIGRTRNLSNHARVWSRTPCVNQGRLYYDSKVRGMTTPSGHISGTDPSRSRPVLARPRARREVGMTAPSLIV